MSAYGAISRPVGSTVQLSPTVWKVKSKDGERKTQFVVMFHLTLASAPSDLVGFMHEEFADEVDRGDTYPQETEPGTRLSRDAFEAYYLAADVLVGVLIDNDRFSRLDVDANNIRDDEGFEITTNHGIEKIKGDRDWKDCIAGFYYVRFFQSF